MNMIREWAAKKSQPYFTTGRFEICIKNFPDLHDQYDAVYAQERQAIVSRYCTNDNGQAHGRDDAAEYANPRTSSPEFCDDSVSANFMRGYDRGWDEQKRTLCVSYDSLNDGYQDGLRGAQPNPSYPELCPSQYHIGIRSSYLDGYDRGLRAYQAQVEASRVEAAQQEPHHNHPQPSTGGDVVQACGEILSYKDDKLQCIQASEQIRHHPAPLIRAGGEAFSYHGDRLQCGIDAGSRNYSPAATVKACQQIVSYSGDIQICMNAVKNSRFEPSSAVRACGKAFSYQGDRLKCLVAVADSKRDPSQRISSCKQSFANSEDVMKCLGGAD